ncbi:MAG TPA: accessory gene regulator B family protein [Methylomusa anaerophila]|uniref:Putative accessory gene regulator protein n=1 Tax=Methylomusa anaerophila TaxID=1930071 RepID=A0A348AQT2_9FIRM|nr:accessory gene regulator B family protein [Methylomusa anaerophila]BBB93430.1 putative accessory gene regulator protein [Methylomusa anaerophila]HML90054.1 accessory gene regulator B family protein [Methylomusa anaerophila]
MTGIKDFAAGVAHYIGEELQLNVKDRETVRFGVEYCLVVLVNLVVIIGMARWLGITPYVLAAMVTTVALRLVSGGAHCSTFFRCLVLGTVVMVGAGQLAALIGIWASPALLLVLAGISAVGGFYAVYKWAPADTPANPIVSTAKRASYRRLSYIFIAVWGAMVSAGVLWGGNSPLVAGLVLASSGGICWQSFSITPAGYRFIAAVETLVDKC